MFLSNDAICVTQNSLGEEGRDPFKVSPETFLRMRMIIVYLEPLDKKEL